MNTLEKVYGQLTVLETRKGGNSGGMLAVCRCLCGKRITVRAVELRAGRRLTCGHLLECPKCGILVRGCSFGPHTRRCDGIQPKKKNQQQDMDLADKRAFKRGEGVAKVAESTDREDKERFIRGQLDDAIPLLAKLYSLPEADIRKIRANAFRSSLGRDRMPIKLLQELVDQRQERLSPEDFAASSSSMALCENEA